MSIITVNLNLMPTGDAYSSGHLVPSLWDLHMFYLLRPILFRTCCYFSGLCSLNIPRYFLDFTFYPRATRCGGDLVTLLWFRASVREPCENDRDYTVACFFVKLSRHVNHDERINPIAFGGQRSKVKVTVDIYGNKLVNTIETKPLCISLSSLAFILTMVRGWTLLILEVRGQRPRLQWTYMEISLWTR